MVPWVLIMMGYGNAGLSCCGWQVEFVDGPLYDLISSLLCTNRCEAITLSSVQASTTEMDVIRIFSFQ